MKSANVKNKGKYNIFYLFLITLKDNWQFKAKIVKMCYRVNYNTVYL